MAHKELTKNGFGLCEWDNRDDRDECENCKCIPDKIYFRKNNDHDGQYWCMSCVEDEIQANEECATTLRKQNGHIAQQPQAKI